MKRILPFVFILMTPALLVAQSKKVKIHAYQQEVIPGMRNITIDESGTTREVAKKNPPTIFIYLEAPRDKKIEPKHVWIDGKLFGVRTSIPPLPVVMNKLVVLNKEADTLVRKTTNQVIQLEPLTDVAPFTPSLQARKKMKSNKIVLHTIENGKNCYYYQNSIKILDPVVLQ